jgi:hypothetical protein
MGSAAIGMDAHSHFPSGRRPQKYERLQINVPSQETVGTADVAITLRGPKSEVAAALPEVHALVAEARKQEALHSYVAEVLVEPQFVKFLIGKEGAAITKLCTVHSVHVDVEDVSDGPADKAKAPAVAADKGKKAPAQADKGKTPSSADDKAKAKPAAAAAAAPAAPKERLVIRGQKDGVEAAKKELLQRIKELVRRRDDWHAQVLISHVRMGERADRGRCADAGGSQGRPQVPRRAHRA